MPSTHKLAVQLAGLLLLEHKRISLSDILSIPFVEDEDQALLIAQKLIESFGTDYEIEVHSLGHPSDVSVRLASPKMISR